MRPRREITAREAHYLRSYWPDEAVTIADIRARLDASETIVKRWASELDLGPKSGAIGAWTEELVEAALALRRDGLSGAQIGKRLGLTKNQVNTKLARVDQQRVAPARAETVSPLSAEYEAMLRRVARWDSAAAKGLAVYERQVAA